MRLETAGAKTWLLAAVTLWAVVLWGLGIAGLGGRIERLADDPSLRQRLPQPVAPAEERLGPLPQYATIGDRPVFSEDRLPHPFLINPEGEETEETFDFVLTSVISTPGLQIALVQPTGGGEPVRIRVGEAADASPAWTLTSIGPRSAVFNGPDGERTLELRVFDGTGGQPPTPVAAAPAGQRAGAQPARTPQVQPPQAQPAAQPQPARPAAGGIPVTTSSGQVNVPAPQPSGQSPAAETPAAATPSPDEQAEAIRRRIDARREQLRREAMQPPNETH